ncbi:hypothetical protein cypCar_00001924 [Cyprinus carpio]|nr:hypothetical protein cypCar_00001924 [Cyprinus carpio]
MSFRIFVIGDGSDSGSPPSPTLEERRRPGNLLIWQERERAQQQRARASTRLLTNERLMSYSLQKLTVKTGSNLATTSKHGGTGSVSGGDSDSNSPPNGLKQRCASVDQVSPSSQSGSLQRSISRTGNSLAESGRSDSRSTLRSPREERTDVLQLRKPKLSAAKCRLNVENFIAACRRLGVPEDTLCPPQLILEEEGLTRIAQTVQALLELPTSGARRSSRQDPSGLPLQSTTQNQDATS